MSQHPIARLGVFVLVVAGVIGAAGVGGLVMADPAPDRVDATVEKDYFTSQEIVANAELTQRSGDIEMADQPSRTVLVSTDGSVEDIEPVVTALISNGHEVRIHGGGGTSVRSISGIVGGATMASSSVSTAEGEIASTLSEVDALLAIGGSQFDSADYETIETFAKNGSVVLATDPSVGFSEAASDELTSRFGVTVGDGYLYNMARNDANYQRIFAAGDGSDLTEDVDDVVLDMAAPVSTFNGTTVLSAAEGTQYATTRTGGSYGVAVQSGNALVIGDTDFMAPLDYNRADNNQLIANTLEFLTDTPEDPYTPPEEETGGANGPAGTDGTTYPAPEDEPQQTAGT
jgi:hypothetical protein